MAKPLETPDWENQMICFKPKVLKPNTNLKSLKKESKEREVQVYKDRLTVRQPGKSGSLRAVPLSQILDVTTDEKLPDLTRITVKSKKGKNEIHQFSIMNPTERERFIHLLKPTTSSKDNFQNKASSEVKKDETNDRLQTEVSESVSDVSKKPPRIQPPQNGYSTTIRDRNNSPPRDGGFGSSSIFKQAAADSVSQPGYLPRQNRMPYKSSLKTSEYLAQIQSEAEYEPEIKNGGGFSKNYTGDQFDKESGGIMMMMNEEPAKSEFDEAQSTYTESAYQNARAQRQRNHGSSYYGQSVYSENEDDDITYQEEETRGSERYASEYSSSVIFERPNKPRSLTFYNPFLPVQCVRRDYY